jgi:cytochrome b subunit of formate dehydrogenase
MLSRFCSVVAVFALICLGPVARAAPTPLPENCGEDCHSDKSTDAKHKSKGVTCQKCHSSVKDPNQDHMSALDDMPVKKMCGQSGCHTETAQKVFTGPHKDSPCETCHGESHGKFVRTDWSACKSCHDDQVTALAASVHGTAAKSVKCIDCHGDVHSPKLHKQADSPMSKVLQVSTCGECHDEADVRKFRSSVHGQGVLKSGLAVAPSCADCHGSHDIRKVKDETSRVAKLNTVETCGKCHEFIVARWKNSTHGEKWLEANELRNGNGKKAAPFAPESLSARKGPVCTDCHSGHATLDPMVYGNNLKMADRCGECHEEASRTYRESFHGKATRLGQRAAAACADCHGPHEMLPAKDPRSMVNPKNLASTCGKCHPNAGAEFYKFDVHMNPSDKHRDARVFWVYQFMNLLLFGVIGFFAVHALLWLQRALVANRRGELNHEEVDPSEPWIRRFRPLFMGIHIAIVVTFLLLAATGLPLKFSGQGWAKTLETILGGPEMNQLLHRIAGVVTFGYAFVYLMYMIGKLLRRRAKGMFWGWQSMMPNMKDLQDLWANLKWFLYLGDRPKLDRWAYWEKFDFFAVFWGIPMIGLSGLILWQPVFFASFLPGWALNVAYVIHSDEALLATGFIFFFHLFHTHLRPEAFPMDMVMFYGGMPLSKFKHERPTEYARLVASGKLEELYMPAPGPHGRRRALYFGAVTLVIGVLLAALLMATGIGAIGY